VTLIPIEVRAILPSDAARTWEAIVPLRPEPAYLVGGTAVAVHIGHRKSRDLDFCLSSPVDLTDLNDRLSNSDRWLASTLTESTLNGVFSATKLQFLLADQETNLELLTMVGGIPVASLPDLFAMKLGVITRRGALRDYYDLMEMERTGLTAEEGLSLFVRRYHPAGVDAALAGVILALGPAAIADAKSDPSGVPKSAVKELERYWPKRQIEVTAHLNRYGAPSSR
jgi:hypothetical protein